MNNSFLDEQVRAQVFSSCFDCAFYIYDDNCPFEELRKKHGVSEIIDKVFEMSFEEVYELFQIHEDCKIRHGKN